MNKFWRKISAIVMAFVLITLPLQVFASSFSDITSDSIEQKEEQIGTAEEEKNALQDSLTDIEEIKQALEEQRDDLDAYIVQLDITLNTMVEKIEALEQSIMEKEGEIVVAEAELEEALAIETQQYESMKIRVQFLYEEGQFYYWDLIFGAEKFSDLINRLDYIEQLSAYDKKMLDEYTENRTYIELCKEALELDKQLLDESKAVVDTEKASLEELISEKAIQMQTYSQDITNKEKAIQEYEAEIAAQEQLIKDLEAAVAEERKNILEQNGVVLTYDGGTFHFPMEYYTAMTSDFGMRLHPIYGIYKMHNGVDFAAPTGTAIYAAYDGIVVAATYQSSMGNYVLINHGDDLYTVYMHASKLYVEEGDIVIRGETIAAVGSTGDSTGPHLHFGVREDGVYVSPWKYITE